MIHGHDLGQGLLQRHASQLHRRRPVDDFAVVRYVDARVIPDESQDVLEVRVDEIDDERLARRRVQRWLCGSRTRTFAQLLAGGFRTRCLEPVAQRLFERGHLPGNAPVARVVLGRHLVLAKRCFELLLLFVLVGAIEVKPRGGLHGAL